MRALLIRLVRRSFSAVQWLDRRDLPVLHWIPSAWKRRVMRRGFALTGPLLASRPVIVGDLRFEVPAEMAYSYLLQDHEPATQELLRRHLRPGMRVVDVGANLGFLSLLAARLVGPEGRVWAVEPGERNLRLLRRNLELNGIGNVEVLPVAAGAGDGRRELFVSPRGTLNSFYVQTSDARATAVEEAPLDRLVPPPVDFVKIDVEGAELEVLSGMRGMLEASPAVTLFVEWNPSTQRQAGRAPERLPHALLELGFRIAAVDGRRREPIGADDVERYLAERLTDTRYTNLLASRDPAVLEAGGSLEP